MAFYQIKKNGYILGVAQSSGDGNISEEEYNALTEIIRNRPIAQDGYEYRLLDSLEWELHKLPISN